MAANPDEGGKVVDEERDVSAVEGDVPSDEAGITMPPDGPSPDDVVRTRGDWVPEADRPAADPTRDATETMDAGVATPATGARDFVPSSDTEPVEDRSFEEKLELAREAARLSVARHDASIRDEARKRLDTTAESQVVDFLRDLSPADRNVYLQVESENRNRQAIFDAYGQADFGDDAGRPSSAVEVRTLEEAREAEAEGYFGAAVADPLDEPREAADLPLDVADASAIAVSPSDVKYRQEMRREREEGPADDTGLINLSEDTEPTTPEINRLKAEAAAAAVQDAGFEEGTPVLGPEDEEIVSKAGAPDESPDVPPEELDPEAGALPEGQTLDGGDRVPVHIEDEAGRAAEEAIEEPDTTEPTPEDTPAVESPGESEAEALGETGTTADISGEAEASVETDTTPDKEGE